MFFVPSRNCSVQLELNHNSISGSFYFTSADSPLQDHMPKSKVNLHPTNDSILLWVSTKVPESEFVCGVTSQAWGSVHVLPQLCKWHFSCLTVVKADELYMHSCEFPAKAHRLHKSVRHVDLHNKHACLHAGWKWGGPGRQACLFLHIL